MAPPWCFDGGFAHPKNLPSTAFTTSGRSGAVGIVGQVLLSTILLLTYKTMRTRFGVHICGVDRILGTGPVSGMLFATRCSLSFINSATRRSGRVSRAVVLGMNSGDSLFCDCTHFHVSSLVRVSGTAKTSRRVVRRRVGRNADRIGCRVFGGCPRNGLARLRPVTTDGFHSRRGARVPI